MFMKKIFVVAALVLCLWSVSAGPVMAQSWVDGFVKCGKVDNEPGKTVVVDGKTVPAKAAQSCGFADLITLINTLIEYLIYISLPLAAIAFAWAGWIYLSAGGDTGKVKKAHAIFLDVGIGIALVLSSWLIFQYIAKTFLKTVTDSTGTPYGTYLK
jgi:hypothetical protein